MLNRIYGKSELVETNRFRSNLSNTAAISLFYAMLALQPSCAYESPALNSLLGECPDDRKPFKEMDGKAMCIRVTCSPENFDEYEEKYKKEGEAYCIPLDMGNDMPADMDMGTSDMGTDMPADMDMGTSDMGTDMPADMDMGTSDMGNDMPADMDMGTSDMGTDMPADMDMGTSDMGTDMPADMDMGPGCVTDTNLENRASQFELNVLNTHSTHVDIATAPVQFIRSMKLPSDAGVELDCNGADDDFQVIGVRSNGVFTDISSPNAISRLYTQRVECLDGNTQECSDISSVDCRFVQTRLARTIDSNSKTTDVTEVRYTLSQDGRFANVTVDNFPDCDFSQTPCTTFATQPSTSVSIQVDTMTGSILNIPSGVCEVTIPQNVLDRIINLDIFNTLTP